MSVTPESLRHTPEGYFTEAFGQPEYTDWLDESMSWKQACYIGDWSFLWVRRYRGPDALPLFSAVCVNSFAKFEIGRAKHVIHCNEDGKVIHEGILMRIADEEFILFGRGGFWVDYILRRDRYNVLSESDHQFVF